MVPWRGPLDGVWFVYSVATIAEIGRDLRAASTSGEGSLGLPIVLLVAVAVIAVVIAFELARQGPESGRTRSLTPSISGIEMHSPWLGMGATGLLACLLAGQALAVVAGIAPYLPETAQAYLASRPVPLNIADWIAYAAVEIFLLYFFTAQLTQNPSVSGASDEVVDRSLELATFVRAAFLVFLTVVVVVAAQATLKGFLFGGVTLILTPLAFLGLARGLGLDKLAMPWRAGAQSA